MSRESFDVFTRTLRALSFMPGDWQAFARKYRDDGRPFHLHCSAQEPTTAEFEVAFDGVVQDWTIAINVEQEFRHVVGEGKGTWTQFLAIRRKDTDPPTPVFVLWIDGTEVLG